MYAARLIRPTATTATRQILLRHKPFRTVSSKIPGSKQGTNQESDTGVAIKTERPMTRERSPKPSAGPAKKSKKENSKTGTHFFDHPFPEVLAPSKKLALVIGIDNYDIQPLSGAVNDARAVGNALERLGFQVTRSFNETRVQVKVKAHLFGRTRQNNDLAVVFFAGHGSEVHHKTYLSIPDVGISDTTKHRPQATQPRTTNGGKDLFSLDELIMETTGRSNPMTAGLSTVYIVDACRVAADRRSLLAVGHNFVLPGDATNHNQFAFCFAADPGRLALEGGSHGALTTCLLKHIEKDKDILDIFTLTRNDLHNSTKGAMKIAQCNWTRECLYNVIKLNAPIQK